MNCAQGHMVKIMHSKRKKGKKKNSADKPKSTMFYIMHSRQLAAWLDIYRPANQGQTLIIKSLVKVNHMFEDDDGKKWSGMNWKGRNEKGTGLKTLQEKKKKKKKRENKQRKKQRKQTNKSWMNYPWLLKFSGSSSLFSLQKGLVSLWQVTLSNRLRLSLSKIYILHQTERFSWLIYVMSPPKPPHFSESILPPQTWSFRDSAVDGDRLSVTTSLCFSGDWCQYRLMSPANVIKQQWMSLAAFFFSSPLQILFVSSHNRQGPVTLAVLCSSLQILIPHNGQVMNKQSVPLAALFPSLLTRYNRNKPPVGIVSCPEHTSPSWPSRRCFLLQC